MVDVVKSVRSVALDSGRSLSRRERSSCAIWILLAMRVWQGERVVVEEEGETQLEGCGSQGQGLGRRRRDGDGSGEEDPFA